MTSNNQAPTNEIEQEEIASVPLPYIQDIPYEQRIGLVKYAMRPRPLKDAVNKPLTLAGVMTYEDTFRDQQGKEVIDKNTGEVLMCHTSIFLVKVEGAYQTFRTQSASVYDWVTRTLRPFLGITQQGDFPGGHTVPIIVRSKQGKGGNTYHLPDFFVPDQQRG